METGKALLPKQPGIDFPPLGSRRKLAGRKESINEPEWLQDLVRKAKAGEARFATSSRASPSEPIPNVQQNLVDIEQGEGSSGAKVKYSSWVLVQCCRDVLDHLLWVEY